MNTLFPRPGGVTVSGEACTVEPACKVRGFVQEKLTIQEGYDWLTLLKGISIINIPIWDQAKLTLYPFWPYISGSYMRAALYLSLS